MYKDGFSPQLWSCWQGLYFTAEHFWATLLAGMFLATWDSVYWLARQRTALYYPAHSLMTIYNVLSNYTTKNLPKEAFCYTTAQD